MFWPFPVIHRQVQHHNYTYEVLPKFPEISLPQLNHLPKFLFTSIPFRVVPFCIDTAIPADFHNWKHCWKSIHVSIFTVYCDLVWNSSMLSKVAPWASISSSGIGKNHRGWGLVSRKGGGSLLSSWKPKTAAWAMRELKLCHDAGPRSCCTICLDVALDVFPQSTQNVTKEFSTHHLSWWNKFLMHMPSMSNFCHIFSRGSGRSSSRLLFFIDWHPSILETLTPFVSLFLA